MCIPPSTVTSLPMLTTNETCVSQILILGILLTPEVCKGVNDDAEDEVENDDVDQDKE